jgi:molybdopterin-binding protein
MAAQASTSPSAARTKKETVLYRLSEAARLLSLSRPTLMQWIRAERIKSVRTPGGHYRIPQSEISRVSGVPFRSRSTTLRDTDVLSAISGRNKLLGTVTRVRYGGLLAEVSMAVGDQELTAVITSASCRSLGLKPGVQAYGLVKATEVMVIRT